MATSTSPSTASPTVTGGRTSHGAAGSVLRAARTGLITLLIVVLVWQAIISILGVSTFIAKGPLDVFNWLFTVPAAAENRELIWGNLLVTLGDSFIGFTAGLVVALLLAIAFTLSRGIEHALMPIAMLLRSVPLVALAPIIILIVGRGAAVAAVMGGIVVLFPALVNIVFGLRSASPIITDVISVYGGTPFTALRKVAMPSSLGALFAAVKISVPGAITGALLAEWLATGKGIGGAIVAAVAQSKNFEVWASVVVITAVTLLLYGLAQLVESLVLRRMGMAASAGE
ncbi:ABC-type nitrate/sulfonate/bicarbonate transport system permease component [Glaciihabitans tibetensis]|uniref:ABC-type nitrate/sulfonate/bicarbonate transport system permease component n=1 Tax=Glaciihabitans tibetensis TaxID=1266600 RepID=A0A2T0V4A4_9MICO|nr:ABC transporter permease subunit [Glaciihabitans tibetensis]PRY65002.1 ABC-type nitrate/sulfonate/bicarbonate transport system permease component [Glaciihabitans tibetensis]